MPKSACTCCNGGGIACPGCFTGTAPDTIQAVFSGISLCSNACRAGIHIGPPFRNDEKIISGSAPNDTYCLTNILASGTQCIYRASLATPIVVEVYSSDDGTCSGSVVSTYNCDTVEVAFIKLGSTYKIQVSIYNKLFSFFNELYYAFNYEDSGTNEDFCIDGTYNSQVLSCVAGGNITDHSATSTVATGGSVSLIIDGC